MMAVPFFIMAGEFMNRGGITKRIVNTANALVGSVRGGLGYVSILAILVFASMVGSAVASTAFLGAILIPMMVRAGYKRDTCTGLIAAGNILSPKAFVDEVLQVRIPNPFMPDTPQRIATDTSQKVGIRYGETIKAYVEKYGDAKKLVAIPLAIAGWCRYLLGVDDQGNAFERSADPMLPLLTEQLAGVEVGKPESYQGQLKNILSNANIFGVDLYQAGIGSRVEEMFVEELAGPGAVRTVLKKYLGE